MRGKAGQEKGQGRGEASKSVEACGFGARTGLFQLHLHTVHVGFVKDV